MGFMWFNKDVKVDCTKNCKNDKRLTLVDNLRGEAHDFGLSSDLLKYLLDNGFSSVENYVAELVEKRFNEEKENRKWRTYYFYVKKCDAPYIINRIGSTEHVKSWEISEGMFKDEGMVRIEYVADKKVLHQENDGIVIDL